MLDDNNVLRQRDPLNALGVAAMQFEQAQFPVKVENPEHDGREITKVVVAGMGGSALAAGLLKSLFSDELAIPFEVVRNYDLPEYVDFNTLVIASSYSGNTEETLTALGQAKAKNAQLAVVAAGGELFEHAKKDSIAYVLLPPGLPQRMSVISNLRTLTALMAHFGIMRYERFAEIADQTSWLEGQSRAWGPDVTVDKNYAKQLALLSVGKTPVFYAGPLLAPIAYKWKISWNENAKNLAFYGEYPEFNHNEFMGWSSHPIEKPFVIFDLIGSFEPPRVLRRMEISDRLLSGMRPKSHTIAMEGKTPLAQCLWGCILADFVSVYVAILNGVDPTPVVLVERLKTELKSDTASFTSPVRHEGR